MIVQKERKKVKGFTLVELVIVIAIVIILSVISVPIYRGYVDKAKMAEGYALLGTILSAQKAYYSEHGTFLHCDLTGYGSETCYDPMLGIDARSNKYFTFFCIGAGFGRGWRDMNKGFIASTKKPEELQSNKSYIFLYYNITVGHTMTDDPSLAYAYV